MSLKPKKTFLPRGESLLSLIMSIGIFALIIVAVSFFQFSIFKNSRNSELQSSINQQTTIFFRFITKELRAAQVSSTGSYPIAKADPRELIFYSDVGNDGIVDRVRYTVTVAQKLERGITIPTGNPLSYDLANEKVAPLVDAIYGNDAVFTYYGSTFNGTTQTTPLAQPVSVQNIRAVKAHIAIDTKKASLPVAHATTTITIRNLRDK